MYGALVQVNFGYPKLLSRESIDRQVLEMVSRDLPAGHLGLCYRIRHAIH